MIMHCDNKQINNNIKYVNASLLQHNKYLYIAQKIVRLEAILAALSVVLLQKGQFSTHVC